MHLLPKVPLATPSHWQCRGVTIFRGRELSFRPPSGTLVGLVLTRCFHPYLHLFALIHATTRSTPYHLPTSRSPLGTSQSLEHSTILPTKFARPHFYPFTLAYVNETLTLPSRRCFPGRRQQHFQWLRALRQRVRRDPCPKPDCPLQLFVCAGYCVRDAQLDILGRHSFLHRSADRQLCLDGKFNEGSKLTAAIHGRCGLLRRLRIRHL